MVNSGLEFSTIRAANSMQQAQSRGKLKTMIQMTLRQFPVSKQGVMKVVVSPIPYLYVRTILSLKQGKNSFRACLNLVNQSLLTVRHGKTFMTRGTGKVFSVFIVDDHPAIVEGLKLLLGGVPGLQVVGSASEFSEAAARIPAIKPDVTLLDIEMPKVNGFAAARRLLDLNADLRILFFTVHGKSAYASQARAAGAAGIVSKNASLPELVESIKTVAGGGSTYEASLEPKSEHSLSPRERQTLSLLCAGLSSKEIASELNLSPRTVEVYKTHLMRKMNVRNSVALSRYAFSHGLVQA